MPGQKICKADRKKINPKFICTVCALLLSAPMQTPCGHLMCYVCLQTLLSSSCPTCPSDGTLLKKEDIFSDAFTRREIMGLQLQCPSEGCVWSGTYKDLQEHSTNCDHTLIQCVHGQCKKEIKRSLLPQHLKTECFHRQVTCDYCNKELAFNLLKEHVNIECSEAPLSCKHCEVTGIRRRTMVQHETRECDEILVNCDFKEIGCEHAEVVKRKDMRQHWSNALMTHVWLLLKAVLGLLAKVQNLIPTVEFAKTLKAEQEEIKQLKHFCLTEVKSMEETLAAMMKTVSGLEKKVAAGIDSSMASEVNKSQDRITEVSSSQENLVDEIRRLRNELRVRNEEFERMRTTLGHITDSMAETTVKLSDMESPSSVQATMSCNGTLLWKIDDFTGKRRKAANGTETAIYSPHFYTSQFGYKMCARVYMNGDGFGKDTHISLFFVVVKGEYDALLPWPFQKKITMMLLDQNNGDHMIDAFRSDAESSSFQRPKNKMNIASGSPLFMPLDGLSNRAYVKDDTMFIKIIVD